MSKIDGISRRGALAIAGVGAAGLALAGCKKTGDGGGASTAVDPKRDSTLVADFLAEQGLDNYGDNANGPPPVSGLAYNPAYMMLIHLKSGGPWEITSNHAHFAFAQPTYNPAARAKRACEIFANKVTKNHGRFKDEPRGSNFQVVDRKPANPTPEFADGMSFSDFNFGHQHDIYIFFEHKPGDVRFDTANKNFVIFSEHFGNGTKTDPNNAFFNASLVTDPNLLGALNGKGSVLRLDNYFTVKSGANYVPIGSTTQIYKMNFVYIARSDIVMLVDPDTGNGQGYDP